MALKGQKAKGLNLAPRDTEALLVIYRTGIIAAGHLVRLIWQGRPYGYLRLRMLAGGGLVATAGFHEAMPGKKKKKRKLTSFYSLTTEGIKAITAKLDRPPQPAWKNRPSPERYYEFWHMGELWCSLVEHKVLKSIWEWIPSRQGKRLLRLPAYAPFHSLIRLKSEGSERLAALYYLKSGVSKKRVNMLKNFLPLADAAGAGKHFIICAGPKELFLALQSFTREFPERNIHVLTMDDARAVLACYLLDQSVFLRELAVRLERLYGQVSFVPAGPLEPGPFWFPQGAERIYVADLVSGHLATFAALQYKGMIAAPTSLLFAYLPALSYYHAAKRLLPAERSWLRVVIRGKKPGEDIFRG